MRDTIARACTPTSPKFGLLDSEPRPMVLPRTRSWLRRRGQVPSPIATLAPGRVLVEGQAEGAAEYVAPISGRSAIGFRLLIERESGMRGWQTVHDHVEFGSFELRDASGAILVRACRDALELGVGEHGGEGGPFRPLPQPIVDLVPLSVSVQGVLFHHVGIRWREWVLEPGASVWMRGSVVSELREHVTVGYRELGRELVLTGGAAAPLEIHGLAQLRQPPPSAR